MTELAKRLNKDQQPYRAIFNYLSETESDLDFKRLSNPDIMYDTIHYPTEFYDWVIAIATDLKNSPRDLTGKQSEFGDPDITLPSNN